MVPLVERGSATIATDTIDVVPVRGNVVATGSGSLNISGSPPRAGAPGGIQANPPGLCIGNGVAGLRYKAALAAAPLSSSCAKRLWRSMTRGRSTVVNSPRSTTTRPLTTL